MKFLEVLSCRSQFEDFSIENMLSVFLRSLVDNEFFLFRTFQHSKPRSLSKICQKLHKTSKMESFAVFDILGLIFGSFRVFGVNQKAQKYPKNTSRMKLILRQLIYLGGSL